MKCFDQNGQLPYKYIAKQENLVEAGHEINFFFW